VTLSFLIKLIPSADEPKAIKTLYCDKKCREFQPTPPVKQAAIDVFLEIPIETAWPGQFDAIPSQGFGYGRMPHSC
jgi:hypothetical protein